MADRQVESEQPLAVLVALKGVIGTQSVSSREPGCHRKLVHVEY